MARSSFGKNFLIMAAGLILAPFFAWAAEKIGAFEVDISINRDSSISVSEKITYDFGENQKHGIFRNIPVAYKARGGNYNLKISDISVSNESGHPAYGFSSRKSGRNEEIKIGDPDILVGGVKTYVINYKITGAFNYFDDHDEFYWNVTGNEWNVPIDSAAAKVVLPDYISKEKLTRACYDGGYGSGEICAEIAVHDAGDGLVNAVSFADYKLGLGEGLTIVLGFPKGFVAEPTFLGTLFRVGSDNPVLLLPFAVFAVLFYLWFTLGRDPSGSKVIVPQYEAPDGLTPAEVGTLVDSFAQNRDVSAEIIDLAVRGYLKINKTEKQNLIGLASGDYLLEKLKDDKDIPNAFDRRLMKAVFQGKDRTLISGLEKKSADDLKKVKDDIYTALVGKGYFVQDPQKVRRGFFIAGGVMSFIAFFFGNMFSSVYSFFSFSVSAALIFVFGFIMPERTRKGVLAQEAILGLKRYIVAAEKDRINFHNAPEKNPATFEKLLPYAMVFGAEKEWAKQFEGMYKEPPSWYGVGSFQGAFSPIVFVGDMRSFSSSAGSVLSAAAAGKSGFSGGGGFGGGFSGGGFGGGGGGSW